MSLAWNFHLSVERIVITCGPWAILANRAGQEFDFIMTNLCAQENKWVWSRLVHY